MKLRFLSFLAMSAMLIAGLVSCSDKELDTTTDEKQPETTLADYTVILWIDGGGFMDPHNLADLNNMILMREDGTIGKNVNVVGSYSVSEKYKSAVQAKGIAPVFSFELGQKTGLSSDTISALKECNSNASVEPILQMPDDENIQATVQLYDVAVHCLKNYADNSSTNMDKSADLAAFIKKAAAEHPAKNYVVYFVNHGAGFDPSVSDEANFDGTNVRAGTIFSAGVAKGIKDSGVKIQTIVFNCCHMAALENIANLKESANYIMASSEPTISGYMAQFIAALSAAGDDVEKMKEGAKNIVDFYQSMATHNITSHGFYDMSYTDQLMSSVKLAAEWFANANTTNAEFMQDVVEGTIYAQSNLPQRVLASSEEVMASFIKSRKEIQQMLASDPASVSREDFIYNLGNILDFMKENEFNYYCFGDMMQAALGMHQAPEAQGLDFDSLKSIYDQYMSILRQMAYIKCSMAKTEDEGYLYASPSVNLFMMNEEGYFAPACESLLAENQYGSQAVNEAALAKFVDQVMNAGTPEESVALMYQYFGGTWYAKYAKLDVIERRYTSSEFDKMTGWSKVLKTLPTNPIYMINPLRIEKTGLAYEE